MKRFAANPLYRGSASLVQGRPPRTGRRVCERTEAARRTRARPRQSTAGPHAGIAATLAKQHPDLTVIINHCGNPETRRSRSRRNGRRASPRPRRNRTCIARSPPSSRRCAASPERLRPIPRITGPSSTRSGEPSARAAHLWQQLARLRPRRSLRNRHRHREGLLRRKGRGRLGGLLLEELAASLPLAGALRSVSVGADGRPFPHARDHPHRDAAHLLHRQVRRATAAGARARGLGHRRIRTGISPGRGARGIEDFSHLWLITQFHLVKEEPSALTVRPPRLGSNERVGVFATRSPFRPNA